MGRLFLQPRILVALILWALLAGPALAQTPMRIISLAPNVTEVLYDLGLGEQVIAVSRYCDYPPAVKGKPKIGGMSNPSLEAIVAMKPDVVVLTDDGNPREIEERLRGLGIRTYVFRAKRLDDLPHEIRALGAALHARDRADRSARRIERAIRRYGKASRPAPVRFPHKVLVVVQPEPLMVAGSGTAMNDVLALLGLHNIAANAQSGYPRYSLEEVIRQAPDVIFIGRGHDDMKAQSGRLLKRLHSLEAVRKGRVYYIGDSLFRMGPRITFGIAEIDGYVRNVPEKKAPLQNP
jgi:iron complex transport system substrate-binding protein